MKRSPAIASRRTGWSRPDDWLALVDDRLSRGGNPARDGWRAGLVLLGPAGVIIGVFGLLPVAASLYLSFFDGRYVRGDFSGLGNYREALTSPAFWNSVAVTLYYLAGTIPATLILGYAVARLLLGVTRGRALFKATRAVMRSTSTHAFSSSRMLAQAALPSSLSTATAARRSRMRVRSRNG